MSGGDLVAVESEIATIEETLSSTPTVYWRDESMQSRYRDLLTARDTGKPPAPLPRAWRERKRLAALMADRNSEYWKGPKAAENQRLYRTLLGAPDEPGFVPGLDGYTAAPSAPPRAVEAAASIMRKLSPSERADLVEAWDSALPESAKRAAVAELASGAAYARPASPADVERFRSDPDNADIARAWGRSTPTRLGTLQTRLRRILSRLSASDRQQTRHWLDSAPLPQYAAIVRHLAGER